MDKAKKINEELLYFLSAIPSSIESLENERAGMIEYLLLKVGSQDWHGVADAAMDIREIEAKIKTYNEVIARL